MTNMEKIQLCQQVIQSVLHDHLRPVCPLQFRREPFSVLDSHLGGTPYVPTDGQIPTDEDGNQLWLCAQINFAQMPPLPHFPKTGILQFFLSDWDVDGGFGLYSNEDNMTQNDWKVVYYPEIDPAVTEESCRAKMSVLWEQANKKNMPRPAHKFDLKDIEEGKLDLWRCPTSPLKIEFLPITEDSIRDDDCRFETLFAAELKKRIPDADPDEFLPYRLRDETPEERELLYQIHDQLDCGGCKIGGHPAFLQCDPREDDTELEAWDILLFQLDDMIDPPEHLEYADFYLNGGTLNFLIRPEDLEQCDFSRVIAQWACT